MKMARRHIQEPDFAMTVSPSEHSFSVDAGYFAELFDLSSIIRFSEQWLSYLQLLTFTLSQTTEDIAALISNECVPLSDPVPKPPLSLQYGLLKGPNRFGSFRKTYMASEQGSCWNSCFLLVRYGGYGDPISVAWSISCTTSGIWHRGTRTTKATQHLRTALLRWQRLRLGPCVRYNLRVHILSRRLVNGWMDCY